MSNIGVTNYTRNLTVIARNAADGFYYAGFITSGIKREEDSHHVVFYNIKPQDVPTKHVINIGGAVPWPALKIGDCVLVGVRCRTSGLECYMPGRVMCLPLDIRHENRFYTVRLYTGRMTNKPRRYIVKIGKEMFQDSLAYIANIRYKQPIKFDSEPNLSGRLLDRGQIGISAFRKKRVTKRAVSAENVRMKHRLYHYLHYHHPYDNLNHHDEQRQNSRPPSLHSVSTSGSSSDSRRQRRRQRKSHPDLVTIGVQTDGELSDSTASLKPYHPLRTSTPSSKVSSSRSSTPSGNRNSNRSRNSNGRRLPKLNKEPLPLPLPSLKCGEEVLARWSDDGWYYFGKVLTEVDNGSVRVLDSTGHEERIKREDILVNEENHEETIKQYDKVIALHPKYVYSYAPATVLNIYKFGYRVQFYDETERRLPESEVYKISDGKYTEDVKYIKDQELKICGYVIARDDWSGFYRPFVAEGPDHQTQQIFLQLPNNNYKKQTTIHVFPQDGPRRKIDRNCKYVIGPLDPACTVYLPAQIVCRRPLRLTFCNGMQNDHAKLRQCFYISEDYYKNATNYFFAYNSQT